MQRVIAYFHGHVQGVGFRASTKMIAQEMGIKGWVQNLPDGVVKVVAEAEKETLDKFLKIMRSKEILGATIVEAVDSSYEKATGEFDSFSIKREPL